MREKKNIIVNKGISSNVNAILSSSSGAPVKKGQEKNLVQNVQLEENIIAPVSKGQKLGEIIYSLNDEIEGHCDIIASDNVNKISLWNMTTYLYEIWYKLIR